MSLRVCIGQCLDGKTITEVSQFWAGVNHFLWLPGEAIFQFLPVGITWSVSRKMGTSQILGNCFGDLFGVTTIA